MEGLPWITVELFVVYWSAGRSWKGEGGEGGGDRPLSMGLHRIRY